MLFHGACNSRCGHPLVVKANTPVVEGRLRTRLRLCNLYPAARGLFSLKGEVKMDQTILGETAAKLMDSLESDPRITGGEIIACGIIAIIQAETDDGPMTFARTMSTEDIHYRAVGLFREGYETVASGTLTEEEPGDTND